MKKTDKAELIEAARIATASVGEADSQAFWDELSDRIASREQTRTELVKPRVERE